MNKEYSEFNMNQRKIISEIVKAIKYLGGESDLLGTVLSWGSSQTDEETIHNLKLWNNSQKIKQ